MDSKEKAQLVSKAEGLARQCWADKETEQAIQVEFKILELEPTRVKSICRLAVHFLSIGQYRKAEVILTHAIQHGVKDAEVYLLIGELLLKTGKIAKALEFSLNSWAMEKSVFAAVNVSICFSKLKMLARALEFSQHALDIDPSNYKALMQTGYLYRNLGNITKAVKYTRDALKFAPQQDWSKVYSNLLFFLSMDPNCSNEEYFNNALGYGNQLNFNEYSHWGACSNKRLRIGFVSGDFREHPVAQFLLDSIKALSVHDLELVAYSSFKLEDEITARFKPLFDEWYLLDGLTDAEAAAQIHKDKINILIDVSGHTAHNRLPVFARRPAPVQVSWLGFFASTGVKQMDYFFRDAFSAPESVNQFFTEEIWHLGYTQCFSIPDRSVDIAEFPAIQSGHITFGCFHTLAKVTDQAIAVWCKILERVPDSSLYLKSKLFGTDEGKKEWIAKFTKHGLDESRLHLDTPRDDRFEYLDTFNKVDIALDTFPFTGITVSVECLWMGVPYISLVGESVLSRMGASMLNAIGRDEWIADSEQGYIEKAVKLAAEVPSMSGMRQEIRKAALASKLFDSNDMAENLNSAFKQMWERFEAQQ